MSLFKLNKNLTAVSPSVNSSTIFSEILTLFKAMQSFSNEIRLDKLLHKLLVFFLQNTGAKRGMILMKENNTWFVKAEGNLDHQRIILTQEDNFEIRNDIPLSLIKYVQHTQKSLIIQTVQELALYIKKDAYLKKVKPQSLFILPLSYQGQLRYLLLLENQTASYVFHLKHLQFLDLLTSQAAILLEKASLYYQATHDPLTGLANRNLLYQFFDHKRHEAKRYNKSIAILFLDIDNFKNINDTFGHNIGDKVLIYFSEQIKACLREGDLAVRLGGDEFIIMLENINDISQIKGIVNRLLHLLSKPVPVNDCYIPLSTSIGISSYPEDSNDIQELLKYADLALYRVKEKQKGRYLFYTSTSS